MGFTHCLRQILIARLYAYRQRVGRGLLAIGIVFLAATPAPAADVTVGDLHATLRTYAGLMPGDGLKLEYRGLPLITRSTVNVIAPDWSSTYFTLGRAQAKVTVAALPDGKRLALTAANEAFALAYTVDLLEENRVVLDLQGTFRKDTPAILEYAAGYLAAPLITGQPYRAETTAGTRAGILPFTATADRLPEALVLPPVCRLQVESRLGTLAVETAPETPALDLFDARKMPAQWLQESPIFWLGYTKAPLTAGQPFHSHVELRLTPVAAAARPARPAGMAKSLPITAVAAMRPPAAPDGRIIPAPQEVRYGKGAFSLNPETRIVVESDASSRRAARELQDRLREDYGVRVATAPASLWRETRNVIVIGRDGSPFIRRRLAGTGIAPVTRPEGYALQVTPQHVLVAGADARGTLYGVFTLLQLLRGGADASVGSQPHSHTLPRFAAAAIRDWPALPVRAVHLLADDWAAFLHRDLIRKILAPHKINTIILESEYVKWQSHPELNVAWGMSKADVRALLTLARDYNIEVIPLVQTLGHVGWMFENNQHLDLAEDPRAKYAYCPSNPKTYALLFDIFNEALELFDQPRFFHIGHDEFLHRGKFAQEGPCRGKDVAELFLADTRKLHDFLAQRGARTLMWGDMILGPGEAADAAHARTVEDARRLRECLPKDILITDWHYVPAPAYPSLKILRDAGFTVWAATWNKPANIQSFARAAAAEGAGGLLQTTWTGYHGNMTALRAWFPQLWAYILAAGYAWNPAAPPLTEAAVAAPQRFSERWTAAAAACPAPGFLVDLDPLVNIPWSDTPNREGWLGYGPAHDLSALASGTQRMGKNLFQLPANRKALGLAGVLQRAQYPDSARIPIGRRAASLSLLMTTGWEAAENQPVGRITLCYRDGTVLPVDLLYGWNIRAVQDPRIAFQAPVVWEGKTAAGDQLYLRAFTLANPLPQKEIAAVEFSSQSTVAAPILLAVSGISP